PPHSSHHSKIAVEDQSGPFITSLMYWTDWFWPAHVVRGACSSSLAITHETAGSVSAWASDSKVAVVWTCDHMAGSNRTCCSASSTLCSESAPVNTFQLTPFCDSRFGRAG